MGEYYYTVASLPMLTLNQEPPITVDYFLDTCSYTMSDSDFDTLSKSVSTPGDKAVHPIVEAWYNWERSLRNELVKMRAQKTNMDSEKYLREGESTTGVFDAAREAFAAANPKIAEEILNSARWRFLDELEASHNFDLTKLIVYYLKLQVAERKRIMTDVNGKKIYKEIYDGITDKIHQSYDGEL